MSKTTPIRRNYGLVTVVVMSLLLAGACSRPPQGVSNQNQQKTNLPGGEGAFETETFQGVQVAAKEILFKLDQCETDDRRAFVEDLTRKARAETKDDSLVVSQVVNACWFRATSSQSSVRQLMTQYQSKMLVEFTLQHQPGEKFQIVRVEPNFVIKVDPQLGSPLGCPEDDLFQKGKLWALSNPDHSGIDINVVPAWDKPYTGSDHLGVGVIDTGIDYLHPDLVDNIWTAPKDFTVQVGTETISCLKDSHGFNAVSSTDKCDPMDRPVNRGHGTHVAGIIGAIGANHKGVVGVTWTTKLLGLKFIGLSDTGRIVDAARTIDFAIELRKQFGKDADIRVLNASWGYRSGDKVSDNESQFLRDTIARAGENGMLFVASAGQDNANNDNEPHYPSNFDLSNLISVTAIDSTGALAVTGGSLANTGATSVHLSAPGSEIYSTHPTSLGYCYFVSSGTSTATPFVSGAGSLILSVPECSKLTASQLKGAIIRGVAPTRAPILTSTGGMLDVYQSIVRCQQP